MLLSSLDLNKLASWSLFLTSRIVPQPQSKHATLLSRILFVFMRKISQKFELLWPNAWSHRTYSGMFILLLCICAHRASFSSSGIEPHAITCEGHVNITIRTKFSPSLSSFWSNDVGSLSVSVWQKGQIMKISKWNWMQRPGFSPLLFRKRERKVLNGNKRIFLHLVLFVAS